PQGGLLSPRAMQRLPWSRLAELVIAGTTSQQVDERRQVLEARRRQRRAASKRATIDADRVRFRVDDGRLLEVVRLRAEASAKGIRPWDRYAGEQLGYS